MSSLPRRLTKLEDDLAALPPEYDAMTLGELDGFIAGVIICPEEIPAEEWLGALWRDAAEDGTPLDPAPTAALSADILDHYRRVSLELKAGEEGYAAIYYTDPDDGTLVWEPWAIGFGEAIQLRMPFWKAVGTSEKTEPEVIEAAIGLMAFVSIAHGMSPDDLSRSPQPEPAKGEDAVDFAAMVEEAGDLIPTWVETLYEWRMMLRPDPVQAPIRVVKIGRNDPCPCGSGSKYKKCCGANSQA